MQSAPIQGGDNHRGDASDDDAPSREPVDGPGPRLVRELDDTLTKERALLGELAEVVHDLQEKDLLLREAEHRLKNILQLACSMLQSQARSAGGKDARVELKAAGERLKTIADLQVGLGDMGEQVRLDQWLPRACRSMALKPGVELDVRAPPVSVQGAIASPLALFASEAVCNAMKYAFPDGQTGRVLVQLARQDGDWRLSVADDGQGDPKRIEPGFGVRLLGLLARQLHGRLEIGAGLDGRGVSMSAVFPLPQPGRPSAGSAP